MTGLRSAIETAAHRAYLPRVLFARLIRFLTILALALSPLATLGTAPASATAHHAAMAADAGMKSRSMPGHQMAGHQMAGDAPATVMPRCEDMGGESKDEHCRSGDCVVACAAVPAIAAAADQMTPHALVHGLLQQPALVSVPHGLVPEAATPPPRGFLEI